MPAPIDFRALFQGSPNPYMLLDRNLVYVEANEAYLRVMDRRREDLIGQHVFDAFPDDPDGPGQAGVLRASFERVLATGQPDTLSHLRYTIPRETPGGTVLEERFWSTTHTPISGADGAVAFILQHAVDVTELHRIEAALGEAGGDAARGDGHSSGFVGEEGAVLRQAQAVQESKQALGDEVLRLRNVFDQTPAFIATVGGPEHVFEYVNAAYLGLVGHRDLVGRPVREAFPEIEGQGFFELLDGVFETGEPWRGEEVPIQLAWTPGAPLEERFVDFVYQPLRGPGGAVRGILVHGIDVTERVRSRRVLGESEARYRTLFTSMDQGFALCELVVGEDGQAVDYRFLEVNDAFEGMTGLADAAGRTARELVPGLEDHWVEAYARAGLGGERLRFQQGSAAMGRWFDVFAAPAEPAGQGRFVLLFTDVSAQQTAELALRASEERARLALDIARVGTYDWDLTTGDVVIDARAREIHGLPDADGALDAAAVIQMVLHPDDDARVRAALDAALAGAGTLHVEHRVVQPGGAVRRVVSRGRTTFVGEGDARRPVRLVGALLDVTAEREAEAALRSSEQRARLALEAGRMGVWEWDLASDAVGADAPLRALWALGADAPLTAADLFARIHPDDLGPVRAEIERALAEGGTYAAEFRIVLPDGGVRWLAGPGRVVLDAEGRPARLAGVNFDVTERRHADDALRESEAFARSLTEASPDCLKVLDLDGRLVSMNAQGLCLMEIDHFDAVEGDYWPDFWPDAPDAARAALGEARAGRIGQFNGLAPTCKGTVRWWDVRVAPVLGADGRPVRILVASRDVTEQAEAQNALRDLNASLEARVAERTAELEAANQQLEVRNRELQDFAHVASHDLQEPLRKICSFAGLLATDEAGTLTPDGRHYVERTQAAAERMSGLIRDLLAFSRVASKQNPAEAVDLDGALQDVLRDLEASLEASGGAVLAGTLGAAVGDPVQIRQVLQNLVGNALKYHRAGVAPVVRVRTERAGGSVRLVVEDDGIGFDPKHADRIFAPFQRLHGRSEYEGTGMGLAIVRRVAERHGGTVAAEGRPGEGATFTVTLPALPALTL